MALTAVALSVVLLGGRARADSSAAAGSSTSATAGATTGAAPGSSSAATAGSSSGAASSSAASSAAATSAASSTSSGTASALDALPAVQSYFANWFVRSDRAKAEQPKWITPLVTVTPRLEQEFRFDQQWQLQPEGVGQSMSGGLRLELIPFENIEVILGAPPYIARSKYKAKTKGGATHGFDNWGDVSFLVKYRLLSGNEEHGNYIVTFFLGITAPTGPKRVNISPGHATFAPTIAFGKGWGNFDFQSTAAVTIPNGGENRLGLPLAWNTAFQYNFYTYFWPELETNYTWWPNGQRTGKNQLFLTPGVIIGRLPLWERLGLTSGFGYQIAMTANPQYYHGWIFSIRTPF